MKEFSYQCDAGPFSTREELLSDWTSGNCRRMLQLYFFTIHKIFFKQEQVLYPEAYYATGDFVFTQGQKIDFRQLRAGDIIYAERIRAKDGRLVDKSEKTFANSDDYITSLHTALYVDGPNEEIWHATSLEGKSCRWSLEKFIHFYHPTAVKRIAIPST